MPNVLLNCKHQYSSDLWPLEIKRIVDGIQSRYCWQITRSTFVLVFVSPNYIKWRNKNTNTTVRFSVRNCTYTNEKLYLRISNVLLNNWQQYSSDLWPLFLKAKRNNCIICWQIAQIIKNAVRLILDNFGIVGFLIFGRIQCIRVGSSHFSLHFDNILSPKAPKNFSLDVLNWRPTE
jgi:hypothetical protein